MEALKLQSFLQPLSEEIISEQECRCRRTWVLVVHNDFLQIEDYERNGDDTDVRNLRRVFESERCCRFAELANCNKTQILETISSEQKLFELFHPRAGCYEEKLRPEFLFLFVLSHGSCGGIIFTDHFKTKQSEQNDFVMALESYTTSDVWNSLADLDFLSSCTKLLFFASCRGSNYETKIGFVNTDDEFLPGWLSSKPNRDDFIVCYATVEKTYSNRNEVRGTWFVQSICRVLDEIASEELEILLFFTKVQFQVCQMTESNFAEVGQTPQLHFFSKKLFSVCASHCKYHENNKHVFNDVDDSDCLPCHQTKEITFAEEIDGKSLNFKNVVVDERAIFYDWGLEKFNLRRGKALVYHDDLHLRHAIDLAKCFQDLDYKVKLRKVKNVQTDIARNEWKRDFSNDGSLVFCILTQLVETDCGLALVNGEHCVPLSSIVDEFSGSKCKYLCGKPKLFFFLDRGDERDNGAPSQCLNDFQFNNLHAGVCAFVGVGEGSEGGIIESVCSILSSEELKNGNRGLQPALVDLIRANANITSNIKPQIISTLPVLVDFPKLKPVPINKMRILAILGALISMTLIIAFALIFSNQSRANAADDLLDVEINTNCDVLFLPSNTSSYEAFSIGVEQWKVLFGMCDKIWMNFSQEQSVIDKILAGNDSEAVEELYKGKEKRRSIKQQLKLIVLFAYDLSHLTQLAKFCVALNETSVRDQCFDDVHRRICNFNHANKVTALGFYYSFLSDRNDKFQMIANYSVAQIISVITDDLQSSTKLSTDSKFRQFLNIDKNMKMFFMPIILSEYVRNGNKLSLLFKTPCAPSFVCFAAHAEFVELKMKDKLRSEEALKLRVASIRYLHLQSDLQCGSVHQDEWRMCENVTRELQKYSAAHAKRFVRHFIDMGQKEILQKDDLLLGVVDEIILTTYSNETSSRLVDLLWSGLNRQLTDFRCVGSLGLVKQMQKFGHLATAPAIRLFMILRTKNDLHVDPNFSKYCNKAKSFAPDYMKRIVFNNTDCNCCSDWLTSDCIAVARKDLDEALVDQKTYNDKMLYRGVFLFWNYILVSIRNVSNNLHVTSNETQLLEHQLESFANENLNFSIEDFTPEKVTEMIHLRIWNSLFNDNVLTKFYLDLLDEKLKTSRLGRA